jgi:hypothetical protein
MALAEPGSESDWASGNTHMNMRREQYISATGIEKCRTHICAGKVFHYLLPGYICGKNSLVQVYPYFSFGKRNKDRYRALRSRVILAVSRIEVADGRI